MTDIIATNDGSAKSLLADRDTVYNTNPINCGGNESTGQHYMYLGFPVPAGTYQDANLRITVGTGTGDETVATLYVYEALAPFDETTLTWNNKPDLDPTVLWSGAGFEVKGASHDIPIPAAVVNRAAGGDLVLCMHSQNVADYVRFSSQTEATVSRRPTLTVTLVEAEARYDLTITHPPDSALIADRTYKVDTARSIGGAATLAQVSGAAVSITESPTGVFTFADPGAGGDLHFDLEVGTATARIVVPRQVGSNRVTFYGGDPSDPGNWG